VLCDTAREWHVKAGEQTAIAFSAQVRGWLALDLRPWTSTFQELPPA